MFSDMIDSHTVTKCDPALYHSPNISINSQFNIWSRGFCCEKEQCIVGKRGIILHNKSMYVQYISNSLNGVRNVWNQNCLCVIALVWGYRAHRRCLNLWMQPINSGWKCNPPHWTSAYSRFILHTVEVDLSCFSLLELTKCVYINISFAVLFSLLLSI